MKTAFIFIIGQCVSLLVTWVLVILKIAGVISLGWAWVLSPIWLPLLLLIGVGSLFVLVSTIHTFIKVIEPKTKCDSCLKRTRKLIQIDEALDIKFCKKCFSIWQDERFTQLIKKAQAEDYSKH